MKLKYILLAAMPLLFNLSCSKKGDDVETTETSLDKDVKAAVKQPVAKFATTVLLMTPPYLEVSGPTYSSKFNDGSDLVSTDLTWNWTSSVDLYDQDGSLTTEKGTITVIKKVTDKGRVAEHVAKAICIKGNDGSLAFQKISSSDYSFRISESSFAKLGVPKASFKGAVELGSGEYTAAVKEAKLYKDKINQERQAKQQEALELKAEKRNQSVKTISENYVKGDYFEGEVKAQEGNSQIGLTVTGVEEIAGDLIYNIKIEAKSGKYRKGCIAELKGGFNKLGILQLSMI